MEYLQYLALDSKHDGAGVMVLNLIITGIPSIHPVEWGGNTNQDVLNLVLIGLFNTDIDRRNKSTKLLIYKFC